MRQKLALYSRFILSAGGLLWATSALAQRSVDIESPLMAPDPASVYAAEDGPEEDHITIGAGGMYQPDYMGARSYQFQPILAADIKRGVFFVNFENGIGVAPIDTETFTVGAGVVPIFDSYDREDVPNQFNKVDLGAGVRGFFSIRQFGFEVTTGLTQIFAGNTKGMIVDFSLSRDIIVNERLFITPSIGARWANAKHNDRFYGVSESQAQESGLRQFRPGAGFLDADAELMLQYRLTDHIGIGVGGSVTTLMGNVKDSPIVQKKTAPTGTAFLTYTF
ncbi:MipA/OmpV family protein [Stakelama pacifica]|uniref:Outer membrane scaffolding protein for murein synthesis (MipA/OmpV family) n=1 Tax=Stakelama pacifica TaxID=517720 RepID=A0A4R6FCM5_9SPHN|nr:MipA/OmpV family protein [Stakelama pacifica]TDN78969.1 outer membrane scaffolding protein for murein synthesis (MipA/OmpV family) [Stakelama pacifica]